MLSGAAAAAAPLVAQAPAVSAAAQVVPPFEFDEVTIAALQEGMKSGKFTARSIAEKYLARIDAIDKHGPAVNSVIELNPDALAMAEALDRERQAQGPRGPLHGIPVLIKDNIATHDRMQTTAGSLALVGSVPPKDAFVAKKLRDAGAVILGKTNLSEWANIRSSHSTSGWSGRGGQTHNPYALDRNPCGSSSGSGAAVAANLCACGHRHGNRWLDRVPRECQRHRRHQAHRGAGEPRGNYSHRPQPGHRRTHGAHRHRRRDFARRADGH